MKIRESLSFFQLKINLLKEQPNKAMIESNNLVRNN